MHLKLCPLCVTLLYFHRGVILLNLDRLGGVCAESVENRESWVGGLWCNVAPITPAPPTVNTPATLGHVSPLLALICWVINVTGDFRHGLYYGFSQMFTTTTTTKRSSICLSVWHGCRPAGLFPYVDITRYGTLWVTFMCLLHKDEVTKCLIFFTVFARYGCYGWHNICGGIGHRYEYLFTVIDYSFAGLIFKAYPRRISGYLQPRPCVLLIHRGHHDRVS